MEIPSTVAMPMFKALAPVQAARAARSSTCSGAPSTAAPSGRGSTTTGRLLDELAITRRRRQPPAVAVQLADSRTCIRGYDTVKDETVGEAKEKQSALLQELRA